MAQIIELCTPPPSTPSSSTSSSSTVSSAFFTAPSTPATSPASSLPAKQGIRIVGPAAVSPLTPTPVRTATHGDVLPLFRGAAGDSSPEERTQRPSNSLGIMQRFRAAVARGQSGASSRNFSPRVSATGNTDTTRASSTASIASTEQTIAVKTEAPTVSLGTSDGDEVCVMGVNRVGSMSVVKIESAHPSLAIPTTSSPTAAASTAVSARARSKTPLVHRSSTPTTARSRTPSGRSGSIAPRPGSIAPTSSMVRSASRALTSGRNRATSVVRANTPVRRQTGLSARTPTPVPQLALHAARRLRDTTPYSRASRHDSVAAAAHPGLNALRTIPGSRREIHDVVTVDIPSQQDITERAAQGSAVSGPVRQPNAPLPSTGSTNRRAVEIVDCSSDEDEEVTVTSQALVERRTTNTTRMTDNDNTITIKITNATTDFAHSWPHTSTTCPTPNMRDKMWYDLDKLFCKYFRPAPRQLGH
ncbi:hypothetical protein PSEUBRA_004581 [Kalmanozyma brasiliensis GHG001]|uniref:uncharacterized protein n=1 Tax=Kalmanozyma brasiliensis (strain GHG001) TaxID=1365824 RepID=UPI002867FE4D|nr:uncharacterized protein PSEUBRA_004581 [Kalmanozyma brasiliensis GHG001]KAF6767390.1 hypothetical protein PSEUBRA_004581 [Kalmanozyma brasiliensis GHG001]